MRVVVVAMIAAFAGATAAGAEERPVELKPGPGVESAQAYCVACHSADYITTQPSKKGKAFWGAEVQKMIKVFKAPIPDADAATITDYLATNY